MKRKELIAWLDQQSRDADLRADRATDEAIRYYELGQALAFSRASEKLEKFPKLNRLMNSPSPFAE